MKSIVMVLSFSGCSKLYDFFHPPFALFADIFAVLNKEKAIASE
ncbi:MAG TPA: hypothetical protein VG603_15610 [Chitinophagales bacterium]|nr:hypothetical protein [Chitinophagales bacterium]